jgi:hypothetical protein
MQHESTTSAAYVEADIAEHERAAACVETD